MNYETEFRDALAAAGLAPHKPIDIPDSGKLIRFRVTGDKAGSLNGWAVLHGGDHPAGAFGSWKSGQSHTWHAARSTPPTAAELAAQRKQREAMRQALAIEREAVQAAAREKAQRLWTRAHPATTQHGYLARKKIVPIGLRQLRDSLVVPIRNASGQLTSLQFIDASGEKKFLTGGQIRGCYFSLGKLGHTILLAEGVATSISLNMATKLATAATFSCGNMVAVARVLRAKFPAMRFIVCADADEVGLKAAREAAQAIGAAVAVPVLPGGRQ